MSNFCAGKKNSTDTPSSNSNDSAERKDIDYYNPGEAPRLKDQFLGQGLFRDDIDIDRIDLWPKDLLRCRGMVVHLKPTRRRLLVEVHMVWFNVNS